MEEKVQSVEPLGVVVVDVGKERLVLAAQSSRCIQSRLTNRMLAARRRLSTLRSERSPVPFLGLVFFVAKHQHRQGSELSVLPAQCLLSDQ